ncbi:hypothetical protein ACLMJK_002329 [Lecanora helva]
MREAWLMIASVELNESVEFKSLPSGLHNVEEDLIYFTHGDAYAGISAFINEPAEESDRNALMLAVGVLLPLSYGRLGKSWKHAAGLKELAKGLSKDPAKTEPLEEFWNTYRLHEDDEHQEQAVEPDSPSTERTKRRHSQPSPNRHFHRRKRAATAASAVAQSLSPYHPALSLPAFLDTFGPLVFPLYKAALLRKRILLVGHAPVEQACNFVYDISILSGLPSSVSDLLPLEPLPTRLQPLFAVGIHDMPILTMGSRDQAPDSQLSDDGMGYGWVANTTDDILSLKDHLYDTLITIPPPYTQQAKEKVWPKLELKRGIEIKATQRDLRRYRVLRRELGRFPTTSLRSPATSRAPPATSDSHAHVENTREPSYNDEDASSALDAQLAEPQSWSALAYNSFMWWASAGEKRTDLDEEEEYDAALLRHFDAHQDDGDEEGWSPNHNNRRPRSAPKSPGKRRNSAVMDETQPTAPLEMTIIAYFHRLTTLILKTLADIVDAADYEEDVNGPRPTSANGHTSPTPPSPNNDTQSNKNPDDPHHISDDSSVIAITSEDMSRMGLDIWSESDRTFVRELVAFYWGRKAEVKGGRVECCGVRIC